MSVVKGVLEMADRIAELEAESARWHGSFTGVTARLLELEAERDALRAENERLRAKLRRKGRNSDNLAAAVREVICQQREWVSAHDLARDDRLSLFTAQQIGASLRWFSDEEVERCWTVVSIDYGNGNGLKSKSAYLYRAREAVRDRGGDSS